MSENKSVSIPRIIFADERSEALIPPSVIMASALQRRGYRIKPFVVGIDEYLVALLQ
jgi:cobyrinic acid a,c-diamide synthase